MISSSLKINNFGEKIYKKNDIVMKITLDKIYNDDNAEKLIAYIKEHLKICPRIEIWNASNRNKETIITKCSKNILTKEQIKEVFDNTLEQNRCLVVYNA